MITRHKPWWLSRDDFDDAEMDRRADEQSEDEEDYDYDDPKNLDR